VAQGSQRLSGRKRLRKSARFLKFLIEDRACKSAKR
jgi:hypothetical protein